MPDVGNICNLGINFMAVILRPRSEKNTSDTYELFYVDEKSKMNNSLGIFDTYADAVKAARAVKASGHRIFKIKRELIEYSYLTYEDVTEPKELAEIAARAAQAKQRWQNLESMSDEEINNLADYSCLG